MNEKMRENETEIINLETIPSRYRISKLFQSFVLETK